MNTPTPGHLTWRTSSYTDNGDACVEVSWTDVDRVYVRDTKDRGGGVLTVDPAQWRALVAAVVAD